MKVVGLTGGIGSGKSTIAKVFETLGIPCYNSDTRAKLLYDMAAIKKQVVEVFGEEVYKNNQLDRAYLASQVFTDREKLNALNEIIHPAVQEDFEAWKSQQSAPYILKEAAILFESGSYKNCDRVILVTAPIETRIERVIARDNSSREEILARIEKQWSDEQKIPLADFIIRNDGSEPITEQVIELHQALSM
jgi:dephospho-CoA kinase